MPLGKFRQDYTAFPIAEDRPVPTGQIEGLNAAPSPAQALQLQLMRRGATTTLPAADKWSPRRSLALIIAASAALWMALLMAGAEAVHLVA